MNTKPRRITAVFFLCALSFFFFSSESTRGEEKRTADPWEPIRFMVGKWEGTAQGQAGSGTVQRTYAFILNDRYFHEQNVSTYSPQQKNTKGDVHEHWSIFSYDHARDKLVLRQFHQEGFVNQYVLDDQASSTGKLVFVSEKFENFDNSWKARETYEILSSDEFIEVFELAPPGAGFDVYNRNHFKRSE